MLWHYDVIEKLDTGEMEPLTCFFLVFGDQNVSFFYMLMLCLFRESEDTALLLLKEIYDKLGVPVEQPQ